MKIVEKTSSSGGSTYGARTSGSRYSEEAHDVSYANAVSRGGSDKSSRVVYSAPVSTHHHHHQQHQHHHNVEGAANSLRSSTKIITNNIDEQNMLFGEDAAKFILENREREKRELSNLNDRLAAYLERMRYLELQNKDMDGLRSRWEQDIVTIKRRYEQELHESDRNLEDSAKIKASLEAQISRLTTEVGEHRRRFEEAVRTKDDNKSRVDGILRKLSETETELNLLRRNIQNLEEEVARLKGDNARLRAELQKIKSDLDQESLKAIEYQNQVQALLKKIEFLRHEHELEINQFRGQSISVVNTAEYQNDLAVAIREIRREFDDLAKKNKLDLESWYTRKVHEVRTTESGQFQDESRRLGGELETYRSRVVEYESTNARLRQQLADVQSRLDAEKRTYESSLSYTEVRIKEMTSENRSLQEKLKLLFETNQMLYAEISIYRKLLDGEEGRFSTVQTLVKSEAESVHSSKEEMVTHTSFQRTNKGNVQFVEIPADGRFIVLENLSINKDEHMGDWKLIRKIDGARELVYNFPSKFTLRAGKSVRVWAKGHGGSHNLTDSLVFEGADTWGFGFNIVTALYNRDGDEKATYVQTTTTSQRTLQS
jgi:intermediate filament protein if